MPTGRTPGLRYPPARRGEDADIHHGERVADPYRWLETAADPETVAWITEQNELTGAFLSSVPTREAIRARVAQLWDYPKAGVPLERGGRWFASRNPGVHNQPVMYVMDAPGEDGRPLLDPNLLSTDGTVAVSGFEVSPDGTLAAYATSAAGSDWQTWRVRDVATGTDLPDRVEWAKASEASWRADGSGFYYGALEAPAPGSEYTARQSARRIRFHRIGTRQDQDETVYVPGEADWLPYAAVSEDGRFLVVTTRRRIFPENQVHVLDLSAPDAVFQSLAADFTCRADVVTNVGDTFYLVTDLAADRGRVVAVSLGAGGSEKWRDVVGETADTLLSAHCYGGKLVCHYLRDARSRLSVHDLDGAHLRDIPLPGFSALPRAGADRPAMEGRAGSDLMHVEVTSFTDSGSLWSHDLATGETVCVRPPAADIDQESTVTERAHAISADGTRVPMFLVHRRDVAPTGDVPVLLYGYGGFNIPVAPAFSVRDAVWVERGGLLAVANLRGGGEFGRSWYDAGRLGEKQNVFDDFCACARWLASSGWTRPERIAINGRSNGGLLVGACLTQHPELFGAAIPEVGVLDMLRFHKFTIGWAWTSDYGDPEDPAQYPWPRAYSPLHHVRPGTRYPATLVMTGDHDDRVVPGHSLKFAAAVQAAQGGQAPILLRVDTAAGHGHGKPTAKLIEAATDLLAFAEASLGMCQEHAVRA